MSHSIHPVTRTCESPLLPYTALRVLQKVLPRDILWWKFPALALVLCCAHIASANCSVAISPKISLTAGFV